METSASSQSDSMGSVSLLEKALLCADLGLWDWDIRKDHIAVSLRLSEIIGQPFDRVAKNYGWFAEQVHPEDLPKLEAAIQAHFAEKTPQVDLEMRLKTSGKRWVWTLMRGKVLKRDNQGNPLHFSGTLMEIDERKRIEEAQLFLLQCGFLKAEENFFQSLVRYLGENLEMDYALVDRLLDDQRSVQTLAVYANGSFLENFTYTLQDTPCGDVMKQQVCCFPFDVQNLFPKDIMLVDMGAESYAGVMLWGSQGQPIGLIAIIGREPLKNPRLAEAILKLASVRAAGELERSLAEEALRNKAMQLEEAHAIARMGRWELDLNQNVLTWSDGIYKIFEIDPQQFGASYEAFLELVHPDDRQRVNQAYSNSLEDRQPYEIVHRLLLKDGRIKWVNEICRTEYDEQGQPICSNGVVQDVTEIKRAELSLRENERLLENTLNAIQDGISVLDKDLKIIRVNQAMQRMYPEHAPLVGKRCHKVYHMLEEPCNPCPSLRALQSGTGQYEMTRYENADGVKGWLEVYAFPMLDEQGGFSGVVEYIRDITERKKMEAALIETQKMASLGTLAAGVAHEINSPLQVITGLTDNLMRRSENGGLEMDVLRRNLETINRNAWRMADITRALTAFTHASAANSGANDLNLIVRDTLALVEHRIRQNDNIQVNLDLQPELPALICDRNQISQVLINLIRNACDAMPDGGLLTISTVFAAGEKSLLLKVGDTGNGIPEEIRPLVFDPFFTTKPVGEGVGLGLSIVMGIAHSYGGTVEIDSAAGQGTEVTLRFPVGIENQTRQNNEEAKGRYGV